MGGGNVGIGTTDPAQLLEVNGIIVADNAIGIGTVYPTQALEVNGGVAVDGYLGVGTQYPGAWLDVEGNVIINDGNAVPGYVLTATDSTGDATWQAPQPVNGNSVNASSTTVAYQATSTDHIITITGGENVYLPEFPANGQELLILNFSRTNSVSDNYNGGIKHENYSLTEMTPWSFGWMNIHIVWSQYTSAWYVVGGE